MVPCISRAQQVNIKLTDLGSSQQLLVVLSDRLEAKKAILYFYERDAQKNWKQSMAPVDAMLGAKGMSWANDLTGLFAKEIPRKKEGDMKSPAGLFFISEAFGYADIITELDSKILTYHTLCIDDTASTRYDKIVEGALTNNDFKSAEKMRTVPQYEFGFIIDLNTTRIGKGGGSCIFVHIWAGPSKSTAGCTAMKKTDLMNILARLDKTKKPLILQLPVESYRRIQQKLGLPTIN